MAEPIEITVARIDEGVKGIVKTLDQHIETSDKRLDSHAKDIDSLIATRDRQRGAAKLIAIVSTGLAIVTGWFKLSA
ncbi:MAG: hypothetical protein V3S69_01985 [Dehalococcoidales bacterium]